MLRSFFAKNLFKTKFGVWVNVFCFHFGGDLAGRKFANIVCCFRKADPVEKGVRYNPKNFFQFAAGTWVVANMPCYASKARRFLWRAATETEAAYLHLPEGVAKRDDGLECATIGKLLAYLMTDFMRGVLGKG